MAIDAAGTVGVNLSNIQGNIFGGFNKDHQSFLFVQFPDAASAQAWLGSLIRDVATSDEVIAFNNLFKSIKARHRKEGVIEATWINVAFSFAGLQVLDLPAADLDAFPDDFKQGMKNRADRIGDVDESAPDNWIEPLRDREVHAIVLVASDDLDDLRSTVAELTDDLQAKGLTLLYQQDGNARQDQPGHEHFGFDDGVSQPGIRDDRVTPPGPDPDQGLPGQDRLWPGEVVLGYPQQDKAKADGSTSTAPGQIAQSGPSWTLDGSYLVFRRLRQNVPGFRDFVVAQAAKEKRSNGDPVTPALMGAKLVGRYESGCPLELTKDQPTGFDTQKADPSVADPSMLSAQKINNFDFASDTPGDARDDLSGNVVPHAAHIRKVYPRNSKPPGEGAAETRRILRRGVAFGLSYDKDAADGPTGPNPPYPDDRGLLFLCYQQSIQRKFEFLMQRWVNNPDFPEAKDGFDLVISQSQDPRSFTAAGLAPASFEADARWVTTTFGEYFFQPSISALLHLAGVI